MIRSISFIRRHGDTHYACTTVGTPSEAYEVKPDHPFNLVRVTFQDGTCKDFYDRAYGEAWYHFMEWYEK